MADLSHTVIYESAGELLAELANETGRPVSWAVLNAHRELLHYTRMDGGSVPIQHPVPQQGILRGVVRPGLGGDREDGGWPRHRRVR